MARSIVTPGGLYSLLSQAFKQRANESCPNACKMPLPFLVDRPDDVSANWRIGTPLPCNAGCDALIAEIVAEMWPKVELFDPVSRPVRMPLDK
jgi:hypothetical protein